jgi:hypothetical protein
MAHLKSLNRTAPIFPLQVPVYAVQYLKRCLGLAYGNAAIGFIIYYIIM